jgi:hypothetical protein
VQAKSAPNFRKPPQEFLSSGQISECLLRRWWPIGRLPEVEAQRRRRMSAIEENNLMRSATKGKINPITDIS